MITQEDRNRTGLPAHTDLVFGRVILANIFDESVISGFILRVSCFLSLHRDFMQFTNGMTDEHTPEAYIKAQDKEVGT